jgi:O-acetyl-ADP-ribose deacetylase (regulator of RNase III)
VYGYPLDEAVAIAVREVAMHTRDGTTIRDVIFACFSDEALASYRRALAESGA